MRAVVGSHVVLAALLLQRSGCAQSIAENATCGRGVHVYRYTVDIRFAGSSVSGNNIQEVER